MSTDQKVELGRGSGFGLQLCSTCEPGNLSFMFHAHSMSEMLAYSKFICLQGTETHLNKFKPQRERYDLDTQFSSVQSVSHVRLFETP